MNAEPPPSPVVQSGPSQVGALESELGAHEVWGKELGSHRAIENHGAGESSNQSVTSWPGWTSVGAACGFLPRVSVQVTFPPDPGVLELKVASGSSWPM